MADAAGTGTLVRGRYVLGTAEEFAGGDILEHGAVRVLDGRIAAVGAFADLRAAHPDDAVRGSEYDLVAPGFVNAHGHFSEGLLKGLAEETNLFEWFVALIGPVAPHLDEDKAHLGTLLSGMQMLLTGITTTNDMFVYDPPSGGPPATLGVVRALDELGLRGVVSYGSGDSRPTVEPGRVMEEHQALLEAARASRLSRFRVGVAAIGVLSDDLRPRVIDFAREGGHGVHVHLQEVREEVTAIRSLRGVSPILFAAREGLLDVPTLAAHCVWLDDDDRETLLAHGVAVAHNPVANMILASGVCPVPQLRAAGITVGIGVDGPASNDRQDYLEAMKTAVLLQRVHHLRARAMLARDAFRMATIEGARALGMQDEVGSLEVGKAADIVVFDGNSPALANVHDPHQALVYVAGPRDVVDVWVDGERSVEGGRITRVDVDDVVGRSRSHAVELARRAGLGAISRLAR
ncbi:MAG: amidohydrolase [Actinomycetota bacterium]|nr:amidohydrolase [Actinomycetota bacterium]